MDAINIYIYMDIGSNPGPMGLHLLIVLVCLRVILFTQYPYIPKTFLIIHVFIHNNHHIWSMNNQSPKNINTYLHTYLLSSKTMRGSLFPLLPLRVKCQNHERVPISPILVIHVLSSCQNMGHQNSGNRDPLMVLALHPWKTLKGSYFPYFP